MTNKFENVPNDPDTDIIFCKEMSVGDYKVLHQHWSWDRSISGDSIIFSKDDVSHLSDSKIEMEVRKSFNIDPDAEITLKRSDSSYVFVNFNFFIKW
ncbi:MAG: hypothetical protein CSA45_03220 [Gammaproteobacteria bacterium]|nr:MAG: hypothetical protein CSA45_03220 [Gammaproteobacteria bacterium]